MSVPPIGGPSKLLTIYAHNWSNFATFVRVKSFEAPADGLLPDVVYLIVLTLLGSLAAVGLKRGPAAPAELV